MIRLHIWPGPSRFPLRAVLPVLTILLGASAAGCAQPTPAAPAPGPRVGLPAAAGPELARPIPYPVDPPAEFRAALGRGTRTTTGEPGPRYWQQWAEYDIRAVVDTDAKALTGSQTVRYHNNAPDALPVLVLHLAQNYHAEGVERVRPAEVTGGKRIERVAVNGEELGPTTGRSPGWAVDGALMFVVLPSPVRSGATVELAVDWSFPLPQSGAGGRMGYSGDELLYLGYWYPHMAVYDDVIGWHAEPFRGNAEFYSNFGRYQLSIDAPAGWLVASTGRLLNEAEVLTPAVAERLRQAEQGDDVVRVVSHGEAAEATRPSPDGRLLWRFEADSVRDVAFAVMREHAWDATRAPVGDRTGDGRTEYARVDAFWRERAIHYPDAARYARHSVDFLSRFTGVPYPWPHMTVVEGGGIIGGGMEYPMITIIGDYTMAGTRALYGVIAHEIAHMWLPMMLSTNERRYAWFDEGTTSFAENYARKDMFPEGRNPFQDEQASYLNSLATGGDAPIMRWSDFHYPGAPYLIASYPKPNTVLYALVGVLGEETFMRAYQEFHRRWAFRHPYPWDMWHTFEDVSRQELEWFWRAWYYESTEDGGRWLLDQAVTAVERLGTGETRITVRDLGWIPMPVHLTVTRADGQVVEEVVSVDAWLAGDDRVRVTLPAGPRVIRVEIDAAGYFPDADRSNNVWSGQ
jgi:hypothetical protein